VAIPRGWRIPPGLSVGVLVAALCTVTRADADLWGHLRFGLDTLRDRSLTSVDPYSFTQDRAWINHEWLSELSMGVAYTHAGVPGLVLLKTTLLVAAFAVFWNALRPAAARVRAALLVVLAFGTIHMTSSLRPQLWTFLGMAVLIRVLAADWGRWRGWLPVLFAIWVNCHGGWIVGLGVLGVWAALEVLRQPTTWVGWGAVVAGSVLATLVNPYGTHLWWFVRETVHMNRSIAEWGPLWGTPFLNWIPWLCGVALIPMTLRSDFEDRWTRAAVLTMLAYASARVMRIESLFVLVAAVCAVPILTRRWPARPLSGTPLSLAAAIACMVVPVGVLAARGFAPVWCIPIWGAGVPDQAVTRSLEQAQPGRLVTFFDWGEYALWHFAPRLRVSMDGRRETIYTDERLIEHDAIVAGRPEGLETLARWRAEYVWLPATSLATRRWLASHGYRIDVETAASFVATRDDLPPLRQATGAPGGDNCFPG
jgi:hypothetical protein